MQVYIITAISLATYLVIGWFLGTVLQLSGRDLWILRISLSLLGIAAAAVFLWFYRREQTKAQDKPAGVDAASAVADIDGFLRSADASLASSRLGRGTRLRNLPVFLILGESNAAKTTTIVESGLQLDHVAGQVTAGNEVIPTDPLNCWFGEGTIFLEASGRLQAETSRWNHLLRRLKPAGFKGRIPARVVLLCCSMDVLLQSDKNSLLATARSLRTQLESLAATLGIRVPVYVLFTKSDRIKFFDEYLSSFSNSEVEQVLGVTLPLQYGQTAGLYAERATEMIGTELRDLGMALGDRRLELLERERARIRRDEGDRTVEDSQKLDGVYEFPREFRRLQDSLVQFLVELCRPSQLKIGPFLRGFYFSGRRSVASGNSVSASIGLDPQIKSDLSATRIFRPGELPSQSRPRPPAPTGVPQWTFLRPLFKNVLLRDSVAIDASRFSVQTNRSRRMILGFAAAFALVLILGMTVSFFSNRALVAEVSDAAGSSSDGASGGSPGTATPTASDLAQMESLAQTIGKLEEFEKNGVPWRSSWGLYAGRDLYPAARAAYFDRFNRLLLQPVQRDLASRLNGAANTVPGPDAFKRVFDALKAYLMITSDRDKSDPEFLSPYLFARWSDLRQPNADLLPAVKNQFDFFTSQLKTADMTVESDAPAVARARRYLRDFGGTAQIYQTMLTAAAKAGKPVQFNQKFPGSADTVANTYTVPGEFSKDGWKSMQDAFLHPDRYFGGEQWVLGEGTTAAVDAASVQRLRERYTEEFIRRWREFVRNTTIVRYRSLGDAALKLRALTDATSPILAFLFTVADNTTVDSPEVARAFQPAHYALKEGSAEKYVGPNNQMYLAALAQLQLDVDQISAIPPGTPVDVALMSRASESVRNAKAAARQLAQNFNIDSVNRIDQSFRKLLEDPITYAETALRTSAVAAPSGP